MAHQPFIRAIIEPLGATSGYYVWAEIVGGKADGFWTRLHYRQYNEEYRMCNAAVAAVQAAAAEKFGVTGLEWDNEIRWGTREKNEGEEQGDDD